LNISGKLTVDVEVSCLQGIHGVLKEESHMGREEGRRLAEHSSGEPVPPAR